MTHENMQALADAIGAVRRNVTDAQQRAGVDVAAATVSGFLSVLFPRFDGGDFMRRAGAETERDRNARLAVDAALGRDS